LPFIITLIGRRRQDMCKFLYLPNLFVNDFFALNCFISCCIHCNTNTSWASSMILKRCASWGVELFPHSESTNPTSKKTVKIRNKYCVLKMRLCIRRMSCKQKLAWAVELAAITYAYSRQIIGKFSAKFCIFKFNSTFNLTNKTTVHKSTRKSHSPSHML